MATPDWKRPLRVPGLLVLGVALVASCGGGEEDRLPGGGGGSAGTGNSGGEGGEQSSAGQAGDEAVEAGDGGKGGEQSSAGQAGDEAVETGGDGNSLLGGNGGSAGDGGAPNSPSSPSLGSATLAQRINASGSATGTLTSPAVATLEGSLFLASAARGKWAQAPDAPSDDQANTFTLLGTTHAYADWPTSKTGLYVSQDAAGSPTHHFSLTWGDIGGSGDEVSLSVVEVLGAAVVLDDAWIERAAADSVTSASVTVDGPALLVAWWWGSGGVRDVGTSHVAVPGDGFTIVPDATGLTSLSLNGYIQVAVATRPVADPGDYTITWTTDDEGAQLYLVAVR